MRTPPLRNRLRLLTFLGLAPLAACPGFGDRLPPDAFLDVPDARPEVVRDAGPDGGDVGEAIPDAEPLPTFADDIAPFLARHCDTCHGEAPVGGAPYALTTLNECRSHLYAIEVRVNVRRDMPPGGGNLTEAERGLLEAWIRAGGPE